MLLMVRFLPLRRLLVVLLLLTLAVLLPLMLTVLLLLMPALLLLLTLPYLCLRLFLNQIPWMGQCLTLLVVLLS